MNSDIGPPTGARLLGVLQAGGRGDRFGPASHRLPKPLQPVGGVPMVERLLRQFVAAGLREVTVITGWLAPQIEAHLDGLDGLPDDLDLRYLCEPAPLGNFGGVGLAQPGSRNTLFAFADLVTDLSFRALLDEHDRGGADITLASHDETYRVTLGELVTDGRRVCGYLEKPLKTYKICSGFAVLRPTTLAVLDPSKPMGISDFITKALDEGHKVRHWTHNARVFDVNAPDIQASANAVFGC